MPRPAQHARIVTDHPMMDAVTTFGRVTPVYAGHVYTSPYLTPDQALPVTPVDLARTPKFSTEPDYAAYGGLWTPHGETSPLDVYAWDNGPMSTIEILAFWGRLRRGPQNWETIATFCRTVRIGNGNTQVTMLRGSLVFSLLGPRIPADLR